MLSYQESLNYLYGLQKHGIKFGLNSTGNMLSRVGNPHEQLRCIHIAGTNGKGSTAAMLSSILREHGFRVGLYTSPHLVRFTERFRINDAEAPVQRILDVFGRIQKVLNGREPPTFFEMVTAMGFLYFAEEQVDWAVIEVGMGGRLDATNVISPRVSIVTNIAMDHQEYLGNTLSAIAREKAGIIKPGVPVVTGAGQPSVTGILKATCFRHKAPLYSLKTDFRVRRNPNGSFQYRGLRLQLPSLRLNLKGMHQVNNAAVALGALEVLEMQKRLSLNPQAIQAGLSAVLWPARLEILQENPLIVLDGAHNPQGAESLREALKKSFSYNKLHLVLGIMEDKDIRGIFRRLLPMAESVIFTQPRYVRAAKAEMLKRLARPYIQKQYVIPDAASAIEQAKLQAEAGDLICITGSLYFAGEVKELFGERALDSAQADLTG
ncbi:bifunctional folylpolyglutamate synthase/dihydrofolate synthase [Desulfoferrobacter suflitae]|uniref:bifunctional folylpolyglutamate synthase/dihydrofolate synthase n=1 Tax=Desulfoferrobacter suflitae TaxID=2865782 RepID=UPI002164D0D0|nr:folylpolyglutamate synthase/dihydrofolate synthase family protein [Desulfoferrobacter suflitae]MCK8603453.1 bifunctional folylpolyglutamate synthase/dihydrofolate synthase [Desulfoferrobacter suflitae]